MSEQVETARQRFIRNGGERLRMMEMQAVLCEREGDVDSAFAIRRMIEVWQQIQAKEEREEADGMPDPE